MKVGAIYFVLYIVLITELLIVITERDDAERELRGTLAALDKLNISKHELPLEVSIPQDTSNYTLPNQWTQDIFTSIILIPENLVSDSEIDSVVFWVDIDAESPIPPFWPEGGMDSRNINNISIEDAGQPTPKFVLRKNGKYCQFSIMLRRRDIPTQRQEQMRLLARNELMYKFNARIETPRILSNDFNAKTQAKIISGLSDSSKIKFLRSLPDSNEINQIGKFLLKETFSRKDTVKFYQLARYKSIILRDSLGLAGNSQEARILMDRSKVDQSKLNSFIIIPRQF